MKLTDLYEVYKSCLKETKHANPNYRTNKLKRKLETSDKYKNQLSFCLTQSCKTSQMHHVYSTKLHTDQAVKVAYELGAADMIQDAAVYLRNKITESFEQAEDLPWPPSDG